MPDRTDRKDVGQAPLRDEAGESREQAQVQDPRGRHRPRGGIRRRVPRRAGLQRGGVLLPGQPPAREGGVWRLAQVSNNIIDQCVAQGVPFARDYAGYLDNRSFGGAQVSRTFYARGQTGQQLLLGAYSALSRQVKLGTVKMFPRTEMLDLVVVDGEAKGITVRDLVTGEGRVHVGDAVCLCTGGYVNVFYLSTMAMGASVTAIWKAHKKGAFFANPCYTQIHPTCIPQSGDYQSKLNLMSESLRNAGRIWVPKNRGDNRSPNDIPEEDRDYYLERT